ncbi:hypothetical protein OG393_21030 [Streptomyces sp. NBC_01216]|uniref:hypothetical protein n=1 Tax=Streptomyces sp. NBC_01216 TaxID=2903778 RepID=UPI002E0EC0D5|nr:hypothetical protein OG393_21030 [Streptomyces sp. NBC_01216]
MRRRPVTTLAATAITLALALTACGSKDEPAAPTTLSPEARASARAAAGLPPEPDAQHRQAYLDALNAIDPRIIKPGKEDQAVSRGLNQCSSIKASPDDRDKLIQSALGRFTVDTRFPEIATPKTGGQILDAVHKNLCPTF